MYDPQQMRLPCLAMLKSEHVRFYDAWINVARKLHVPHCKVVRDPTASSPTVVQYGTKFSSGPVPTYSETPTEYRYGGKEWMLYVHGNDCQRR